MKKPPDNLEFQRFTEAMRGIMQVPKSKIYAAPKREKQKPSASASLRPNRIPIWTDSGGHVSVSSIFLPLYPALSRFPAQRQQSIFAS
jgi:hypothetical protein